MKSRTISLLLVLFGLLLFNFLFWNESLGINLFLFAGFLILFAKYRNSYNDFRKETYYALLASVVSGLMVVWHNSGWSIFIHFLTTFIALGFVKHREITTVFEAFIGFIVAYFTLPLAWLKALKNRKKENKAIAFTYSFLKLCVVPIVLFVLFFIIYKNANPRFDEITSTFTKSIMELFKDFSFARFFFLLFGFSFISIPLIKGYMQMGQIASPEDELKRTKNEVVQFSNSRKLQTSLFADLLNEYKIGLLIFVVLNALLLVVNLVDISWIWIGFEVPLEFNLKQFVHEGTYLLIFSILLSMLVFLYFFRRSLNFYPKNKWLVLLGKLWVAQNIILTLSVFIRNYHYISYHGLAGKRIGVIAFLVMTVFGLVSLIIKVDKLKTIAYLVRLNGWFILMTMTLMTCINWDRMIAYYNLNHSNPSEIDVDYYLKLSPSVAPLIFKNLEIVEGQMEAHKARQGKEIWLRYLDIDRFKDQLEYQTSLYLNYQNNESWVSWNWADHKLKATTELLPADKPIEPEKKEF